MARTLACRPLTPPEARRLADFQPLVRWLARRFARRLPRHAADVDELTAAANLRLARDLPGWRADGGQSLRTFAGTRATLGMIDHLRASDHLARTHRRALAVADAPPPAIVRFRWAPCRRPGPLQVLAGGLWDEYRPLRLARLHWRQRVILALLIVEGWTQAAVGRAFGVSERRISYLVTRAGVKLRGRGEVRGG